MLANVGKRWLMDLLVIWYDARNAGSFVCSQVVRPKPPKLKGSVAMVQASLEIL